MATVDQAIVDVAEMLRAAVEHPGVYVSFQGRRRKDFLPSLARGPGEGTSINILVGAKEVWETQPMWEAGRATLMDAVYSCAPYFQNVAEFQELMITEPDFAAAFSQAFVQSGRALPPRLTVNADVYHCKECGRQQQLSRSPDLTIFHPRSILRRSSTVHKRSSLARCPRRRMGRGDSNASFSHAGELGSAPMSPSASETAPTTSTRQ